MRLIYERGAERIAFPIDEGETFIGRKDYCDIYFPDASLSKRHARLLREGGVLWVHDAGSRNGTLVNGEEVEQARLASGDVLQCGKLRFLVEGVSGGGGGGEARDYDFVPDSGFSRAATRSGTGVGRSSQRGSRAGGGPLLPTARAVASTDARPSMLDVLPELPPSVEVAGVDPGADAGEPRAARPVARFRLVDGGPEQVWELIGDTVTVGSKQENLVQLVGEGVSRYHAEVAHEDGVWLLKDLGARNGLFIAGERIDIHALKDGDEVQIGTCRLRFELPDASPLDGARQALAQLLEDPARAFKTDPRVRISAVALLTALVLIWAGLSGGAPADVRGEGPRGGYGAWLQEGSDLLVASDFRQARAVFRKARVGAAQHSTPEVLESIAGLWMNLERGPLSFRWDKGTELLEAAARLEGLPSNLSAWLKAQATFVDRNREAFRVLTDAERLGADANDKAVAKSFAAANDQFHRAIRRAREVPADSLLHPRAQELIGTLLRNAYQALLGEIHQRMRAGNPRWDECLALIGQALDFAEGVDQQAELRRLGDECQRNRRDEAAYMRGVQIVQLHQVARYREAVQYFERVDPQSRVHPDAQAYIEWIDADLKVRQAKRAYDLGDWRRARDLLALAVQHEVLGPEAKASVRTRHQKWSRVYQTWRQGMREYDAGDMRQAKAELERVLQLEPNRSNRFHLRARQQLQFIAVTETADLKKKIERGYEALERGTWDQALHWFSEVAKDPTHTPRDLDGFRRAVDEANRDRRLLSNAERLVLQDRTETFIELRDIFTLLVRWLPKDHPDRPKALKLYKTVIERLKHWQKMR